MTATATPLHPRLASTTVADIAATVCTTYGRRMPLGVAEALMRLLDSHGRADARDLANACQAAGGLGLAAMLDDVLAEGAR